MPSPSTIRYFKKKAVLFGMESAYGTDPTLVSTDWFEARNVTLTPYEPEQQERNIAQAWMGNSGQMVVATRKKLSFDVALAASGTVGVAPKIGKLLRAGGNAETITAGTKVEYTLISGSFESAAFYIEIDRVKHVGVGVRLNPQLKMDAKGVPLLGVECMALYAIPTDISPLTVDRSGWPVEKPVNASNTPTCKVNNVNCFYSKFGVNYGNQVQHNLYAGGYEQIQIGDRQPSANLTILAETLATLSPYALASAATNIPVQVVHGTTAGNKVQVDLKAVITGVNEVELNGNVGYDLTLSLVPVTGNDEIKLTFL